jgi:hypothetical protein
MEKVIWAEDEGRRKYHETFVFNERKDDKR